MKNSANSKYNSQDLSLRGEKNFGANTSSKGKARYGARNGREEFQKITFFQHNEIKRKIIKEHKNKVTGTTNKKINTGPIDTLTKA